MGIPTTWPASDKNVRRLCDAAAVSTPTVVVSAVADASGAD
ncbi:MULTISPECIES: hypothetical protein [Haloferax]|nr:MULTISPECIES: hypothetical protein [Haloferax]